MQCSWIAPAHINRSRFSALPCCPSISDTFPEPVLDVFFVVFGERIDTSQTRSEGWKSIGRLLDKDFGVWLRDVRGE